MQGVQISNGGQQVDARAGTNGGVHAVLQHPQAAALALHPGGHEQVRTARRLSPFFELVHRPQPEVKVQRRLIMVQYNDYLSVAPVFGEE